jgi:hypothetical protein
MQADDCSTAAGIDAAIAAFTFIGIIYTNMPMKAEWGHSKDFARANGYTFTAS